MKIGLKFRYTCPEIDREINRVKDTIQCHFEANIEQLCPLMDEETIRFLSDKWTNELYSDIESAFETVRDTNSSMRDCAETQISELETKVEQMESKIDELESTIDAFS